MLTHDDDGGGGATKVQSMITNQNQSMDFFHQPYLIFYRKHPNINFEKELL